MFMRDHKDDNKKRYNSFLYNRFSYDTQFLTSHQSEGRKKGGVPEYLFRWGKREVSCCGRG